MHEWIWFSAALSLKTEAKTVFNFYVDWKWWLWSFQAVRNVNMPFVWKIDALLRPFVSERETNIFSAAAYLRSAAPWQPLLENSSRFPVSL